MAEKGNTRALGKGLIKVWAHQRVIACDLSTKCNKIKIPNVQNNVRSNITCFIPPLLMVKWEMLYVCCVNKDALE